MKTLIIDDDRIMRRLIGDLVTARGHESIPCEDAETAWSLCQKETIPLIFLDLLLAGMNGLEFCRRLRALPHGDASVVIVVTGSSDHDDLQRVLEAGADDYLPKPLDMDLLDLRLDIAERRARIRAERRQAMSALYEAEELCQRIVASSLDGIIAFDTKLCCVTWNSAMEQITGIPGKVARHRPVGELLPFLVESGELEKFKDVIDGRSSATQQQEFQLPETGRAGYFSGQYSPLTNRQGEIIGGVAVIRDTTRQTTLEQQFWQTQKMEAVGQLAGGIAHDFNNLMAVMLGYTDLMLGRLEDDPQTTRHLTEIKKAGSRAAGLTRQLLAFSRRQVMQPKVIDINQALADLESMLRTMIGENIDFALVPGLGLGNVRVDPAQIEQVMMNLVVNACDAMPKGGRLIVQTEQVELGAASYNLTIGAKPGPYVMISVRDTGCGIGPETRQHIFEPFFSTKSASQASGLGLASVYGIIKQSGGDIYVYSELGIGSIFKIYLPVVDAAPSETAVGHPRDRRRDVHGTVVLVEDETGLREIVKTLLVAEGYAVLEARHSGEALEICSRYQGEIDLLLTDVIMPMMNGYELASEVQRLRPETRVLYMSGYSHDSIVEQGLADQDITLLEKPFTGDDLLDMVDAQIAAPPRATCSR